MEKDIYILGIESSCDDTSASVIKNGKILSNIVSTQKVHEEYGGVVPELASRAHQQSIIPVVDQAIKKSGIELSQLNAVAFTSGPGLMGSLLVGTSFAKSLSMSLNIPLIEVNHMQGHILANFIQDGDMTSPNFPFLTLVISGGHTQIVKVNSHFNMEILGETIDDAAGEAFDKSGKIIGLPYPGGPLIDKYAKEGNPKAFKFTKPRVDGYNFSFSGLKTNILYFVQKQVKENPDFVKENLHDLCASIQFTIVEVLMDKLKKAVKETGITEVAMAGGVSANSEIRARFFKAEKDWNWTAHVPKFEFTTDNAAMIAMVGYLKYKVEDFSDISVTAKARFSL
ncbi:MAG: tRNA (adenosine(37)-N6)-threonylcarbamoyltransferase complex transferase subunit TsaD [Ichthyobacteriaceae bacterium]|nr:tRNA (adenosine(37)-N6)-threonylcarbamoyltransferase complex transferase subunit TsaD [Ichthyobacteriaceae bacterium]